MKKGTIIALVVAILLLLSGGVMLVLGLSFAEDGTQSPKLNERTVPITDPFTDLMVKTADCDVSVHLVSTWEEARVEFAEYSQTKHQVSVEDGTLRIELTDHRRWFDWVGVFWEDMHIRVYLPVGEYAGMHIITATGDIEMPAYLTAQDVTLYSDTGDVYSEAQAKYVSAETNTGHIVVCACNPEFVVAKSDTGGILLATMEGVKRCAAETATGSIEVHNVACETAECESDTGKVKLWLVNAENDLQISADTGKVEIGNSTAGSMKIETDTGSIEIQESEAGLADIESDTGSIRLPAAWKDRNYHIETDTGRIHYE